MRPQVLLAEVSDGSESLAWMREQGWGRMICFRPFTPYLHEKWGFDNGAFDSWQNGNPWDEFAYLERLERARRFDCDPLVAVVPDIVAGGCESLEFSMKWLYRLPHDWPWYLAVQDGMEPKDVEQVLHMFSGVFLGGTDKFKTQAYRWAKLAHGAGKKFHYGRCGTIRKLRHAVRVGADSLDSSYPLWTKRRREWFRAVHASDPQMEMVHA